MARSVGDVALFLSAIAGPIREVRLSIPEDGARFGGPLGRIQGRARRVVAWTRGIPFEPDIRRVVDANRRVFEDLGCVVEEAEPDFAGVDDAFPTLRYTGNHPQYAPLVRERPEWVKDTIKYEVAEAEKLTAADVGRGLARQARMYDQSREFFERYDYFVLPVTQVVPFDVTMPVPDGDRRHADDVVHRLDALVLVHHVDGEPGDLRAWRVHREWTAGGPADCRPSPRRLERAAARPRVRAGDGTRRRRPARRALGLRPRGGLGSLALAAGGSHWPRRARALAEGRRLRPTGAAHSLRASGRRAFGRQGATRSRSPRKTSTIFTPEHATPLPNHPKQGRRRPAQVEIEISNNASVM